MPGNESRYEQMLHAERLAGELRTNLLRLIAVGAFYANHLVDLVRHGLADPAGRWQLWTIVSVVVMWLVLIAHVTLSIRLKKASPTLMFHSTLVDLILTSVLLLALQGANSWLVLIYLLIIASAPLRMSIPLVRFATVGSIAAYLIVLIQHQWLQTSLKNSDSLFSHRLFANTLQTRTPLDLTQAIIVLVALLVAGLLAGQAVRQTLRIGRRYDQLAQAVAAAQANAAQATEASPPSTAHSSHRPSSSSEPGAAT